MHSSDRLGGILLRGVCLSAPLPPKEKISDWSSFFLFSDTDCRECNVSGIVDVNLWRVRWYFLQWASDKAHWIGCHHCFFNGNIQKCNYGCTICHSELQIEIVIAHI